MGGLPTIRSYVNKATERRHKRNKTGSKRWETTQYCVLRMEFGTNSVQLRERKNGSLAPKRHQMKHLDFLILLLESRRSSPSSYSASCWTYGIARGVYPENASHEDSTPDLYLIKITVMAPTTARTVKKKGAVNTENSVRSENTGVPTIREIIVATTMSSLLVAFFALIASTFRTRAALQAEILALRHQLAVFQKNGPRRLRLHRCDRLLWVLLYRFWSGWRRCLAMVQPDTVIRWHRKAFAWH